MPITHQQIIEKLETQDKATWDFVADFFTDRTLTILQLRFGNERKSRAKIGADLGISGSRVAQIEHKTIRQIAVYQHQHNPFYLSEGAQLLQDHFDVVGIDSGWQTRILHALRREGFSGRIADLRPIADGSVKYRSLGKKSRALIAGALAARESES